ncbi:hypothetical protein [Alkaliphilus metalliredigens]|nr:hypothetical protein [Alkaliphilus metalliredigens]
MCKLEEVRRTILLIIFIAIAIIFIADLEDIPGPAVPSLPIIIP